MLTTACAVVLGAALHIEAPLRVRMVVACYFLLLAIWAVLRGPRIIRRLRQVSQRQRIIQQHREEIVKQATQRRNLIRHDDPQWPFRGGLGSRRGRNEHRP